MISTGALAGAVATTGLFAWAGAIVFGWWDMLTAWLFWGTVVLCALLVELRRTNDRQSRAEAVRRQLAEADASR